MEIVIFKDLTTEDHLQQLEEAAKKYDGLYVDMENKEERKFVKDKAYDIQQLLKQVDRKRIDESKNYKSKVETEAAAIKLRLEDANAPFMILINQHKAERASILAEAKAAEEAKALAIQIEDDHEFAIMHDKIVDVEKAEAAAKQHERDEQLKADAIEQAVIDAERSAIAAEEKRLRDIEQATENERARINAEVERLAEEKAAREANTAHRTGVKTAAKQSLMQHAGLTEAQAIATVKALCVKSILNITINF